MGPRLARQFLDGPAVIASVGARINGAPDHKYVGPRFGRFGDRFVFDSHRRPTAIVAAPAMRHLSHAVYRSA